MTNGVSHKKLVEILVVIYIYIRIHKLKYGVYGNCNGYAKLELSAGEFRPKQLARFFFAGLDIA